jgi:ABC-type lipoprotein export system ATPase subunit
MITALARPQESTGFQMIRSVEVRNFRCFEALTVDNCRRINVIVGDNGSGKTALLEAMFLALGMSSEYVMRFRTMRGLDGNFRGSPRKIEDAIWNDYFFGEDQRRTISITLNGTGPEARSLRIARGSSETLIPLKESEGSGSVSKMQFHWKDANGKDHLVIPSVSDTGVSFPSTGEDLPDFFIFGSTATYSSTENADRFSELSRSNRQRQFVELFTKEYAWIKDLSIEVVAGSPAVYATVAGLSNKVSLPSVSGGINRIVTVLLAIASRPRSVLLVDEIDNGLHHKHHLSFWTAVLSFAKSFDSQLFVTTHNEEWLEALSVAAAKEPEQIALWRLEREGDHPVIRAFQGKQAVASMGAGEVR